MRIVYLFSQRTFLDRTSCTNAQHLLLPTVLDAFVVTLDAECNTVADDEVKISASADDTVFVNGRPRLSTSAIIPRRKRKVRTLKRAEPPRKRLRRDDSAFASTSTARFHVKTEKIIFESVDSEVAAEEADAACVFNADFTILDLALQNYCRIYDGLLQDLQNMLKIDGVMLS